MRLSPAPMRSRMRGARTATGPRPVMIARSGRWPWRTSRWRPSSVCVLAWRLRKAATSASTACANRARAPSRRTSVSGSENSAGWISLTPLSWIMACHSFGGEVEARTPPRYAASTPHAVTNFRAYLGKPLVNLNFEQQRYEADFRFSLARLREYGEQVALLGGERAERERLGSRFGNVIGNFLAIVSRTKRLTAFTASYQQANAVIPYILIAPYYFAGKIPLGGMTQTAGAFARVESTMSFFI